jgi:hypothetical protein
MLKWFIMKESNKGYLMLQPISRLFPKFIFFLSKIKIKRKIKTIILEKASLEDFICRKNQTAILDGIGSLIVYHLPKTKKTMHIQDQIKSLLDGSV